VIPIERTFVKGYARAKIRKKEKDNHKLYCTSSAHLFLHLHAWSDDKTYIDSYRKDLGDPKEKNEYQVSHRQMNDQDEDAIISTTTAFLYHLARFTTYTSLH